MTRFLKILLCATTTGWFPLLGGTAEPDTEPGERESPATIRVMTYNIHHARGVDGDVDIERIAKVIQREEPDFVALQEVDRGVPRSGERDLTAELAALTGMTGYFEKNHPVAGGEYGNALLSRHPILERKNTHFQHLHDGEQRGVLQAVVEVKGRKLLLLNTHLAHRAVDVDDRLFCAEQVETLVGEYADLPVIFAGDFNERPDGALHERLSRNYVDVWKAVGDGDGFTHASEQPNKRIDYIWLSGERGLTPLRSWVPETLASDHMPLVAEIELRGETEAK